MRASLEKPLERNFVSKSMEVGNLFSFVDWVILFLTLAIPLFVGIYYGVVSKKTTEELLVGGRNLKIIPVAASLMASTISAITVIGFPAEVYSYGTQIFHVGLMSIIFVPISVQIFVPYFYDLKLTSVYEYLEYRFDSVSVRLFASFTFIFQQIVLGCLILYAPSIAMEAFLGFPPFVSIVGIGVIGTIYTAVGGLKAVVWTDTFQLVLMYVGMLTIMTKCFIEAGGITRSFELAAEGGRLDLFDFTVDPFMRHNLLNFIVGFAVLYIVQYGVRQHEVQRYSSLPTLRDAKISMLLAVPIKVVALGVALLTGIALYAFHANCDPISLGEVKKADELIPSFVIKELGGVPGMLGLFTSCMFCALLSSYSSSLNGIVAVTWKDFLSKVPACERMDETNRTKLSVVVGAVYGVLIMTLAMFAKKMGNVFQASYAVTGPPAGVLCAIFVMGLFVPFVHKRGVFAGMIIGLASSVFICFQAALTWKIVHPTLDLNTSNCSIERTNASLLLEPIVARTGRSSLDWPEKIYTMSYVLYPAFSAGVTFISAILFSITPRVFWKDTIKVDPKYLHPWIRSIESALTSEEAGVELELKIGSIVTNPQNMLVNS